MKWVAEERGRACSVFREGLPFFTAAEQKIPSSFLQNMIDPEERKAFILFFFKSGNQDLLPCALVCQPICYKQKSGSDSLCVVSKCLILANPRHRALRFPSHPPLRVTVPHIVSQRTQPTQVAPSLSSRSLTARTLLHKAQENWANLFSLLL